MILVNEFEDRTSVSRESFRDLLIYLAPFAPHLADHLWEKLGEEGSVHSAAWPEVPELSEETVSVVVQVGGKRRGEVTVSPDASEAEVSERALELEPVQAALRGEKPTRVIYVPGRIINFVP